MKSTALPLVLALFLLSLDSQAQINDCPDAQVLCDNQNLAFNPIGPGFNDFLDPDNDQGCITAFEQNSAWYYFEIDPAAPAGLVLGFTIRPNGGLGEDYDWALYGPDVNCGALGSPIRCSSSSAACGFCPETGMGMGAMDVTEGPGTGDGFVSTLVVQPGQGFYLLIDNWAGTTNGFVMQWTGTAADYLNCDASPPCALDAHAGNNLNVCEGDEDVVLNGGSTGNHDNEVYSWTGTNGGSAFLSDPNSEDPMVNLPPGFTGTITYTLVVTEDTCTSEDQMDLIVHALPVVNINPAGPFCPNQISQALSATPPGGIWGGDATGNTFNPVTNGPGIHTVTYTYTGAFGCTSMTTMDILVHDGPTVTIDPTPASYCESEGSVLLTATAAGGTADYVYNWNTPGGTAAGDTYDAQSSGAHTVTVTDANGCTNSSIVTVTEYLNPIIEFNDPGLICGSISFMTIYATPPGGLFEGLDISGTGDLIPSMMDPGIYAISYTFTDNHNCSSTEFLNITIIPVPAAIATNSGPVCAGQPFVLTGATDVTGSIISYQWTGPGGYSSNVQNPTDATLGGTYLLEVIVDDCPSATGMTTVVVTDAPEAFASNGGPYCNGEVIQLTGTTNQTGNLITYSWSGPGGYISNAQNPSNATAQGNYTLIVTVDGCASQAVSTDVSFSIAPDASASNTGPYCQGESIALSGSTVTLGTLIAYSWTGPSGYTSSVQNPIDALLPGVYQLVVDVDGCKSDSAFTTVDVYSLPQLVITGQSTFCTGFSSTMDAGAGYMSYMWDNGSMSRTRNVTTSGTYHVTVTDLNGCTGIADFVVTENTALSPVINGTLEFCEGGSTILDAGSGYAGYLWSTSGTSQTISVPDGGNFSVTVTDADGCTGSSIVAVIEHANPNVVISGSSTYCIGSYTILDAGVYNTYLWNTDSVTQSILVSAPGLYVVSVTDINGCTDSGSIDVEESTSLNPVITGDLAFCENGSTTLNAGSFATYLWSDGSINQTLVVSVPGVYSVSVSDGQGCTGDADVTITEVLPPSAIVQPDITLCNTDAGGSVLNLYDLILSGDINGNWQDADNSGAAGLFSNLNFNLVAAGDYRFRYTTNSAVYPCPDATYEVVVTVLECTCPDVVFVDAGALCNAADVLNLNTLVTTSEAGSWTVIQTPAGTNPAVLNGTVFDAIAHDPGIYALQFVLQGQQPPGCPSDFEVSVQVDPSVDAGTAMPPSEFCAGESQVINLRTLINGADANGIWTETSSVSSQGGAFDPANATFDILQQLPGTYTFMYGIASNGVCPDDQSTVTVMIGVSPTVSIVDNVVLDCTNPIQNLDATGSTYGPEYEITWTGPGIVIDGSEQTLKPTIDQAGVYQLTIRNTVTGCSGSTSTSVISYTDPPTSALVNSDDPLCFEEENGFIHVNGVNGGSAPFVYSINNGPFTSNGSFDQLPAGNYALIVQDENGCRWDTMLVLTEPREVSIDIGPDLEIDLGDSAYVEAVINLPADEIELLSWNPAQVIGCLDASCLEGIVHTFYSLTLHATVSDLNGCESSDALNIVVNKRRRVYIPNIFSPNGDNVNDVFYISGNAQQITGIKRFTIFNRWGGVVHDVQNFSPNDVSMGWDGQGQDRSINPGVFTYVVEIEFIDKIVLVYTGDVTLVR